jgi:HNH endonuclease
MADQNLEVRFFRRVMADVDKAKALGYNPSKFVSMLHERGASRAVRDLIESPAQSEGFSRLWEMNRLDLTAEALALEPEWVELFTEGQREVAQKRLESVGYKMPTPLPPLVNAISDPPQQPAAVEKTDSQATDAAANLNLAVVETTEQVETNFWNFHRQARDFPARRKSLFVLTDYWVMDEISRTFAPSKFIGYQNMTFDLYEKAKATELPGGAFDGSKTRAAIQTVLNDKFAKNEELATELQGWGVTAFGPGAFGGANPDKWHFLQYQFANQPPVTDFPDEVPQPKQYFEGATKTVSINVYERDQRARAACLLHYGTTCMVCGFDFALHYGERGAGFIHVHHVKALSEIGKGYMVDPVKDLRPVCPNCHAMLHRPPRAISIEELREILKKAATKTVPN